MFFIYLMAIEDEQERKTIEELYEKYRYQCFYMAMKYVKNQHTAEDIVQDIFIKIIKHREKYLRFSCSDMQRIFVIMVRHAVIDYYRKEKNAPIYMDDFSLEEEASSLDLEELVILNDNFDKVLENLRNFDEVTQSIIYYRSINVPVKTIATMLGMTKKNVELKLYRARKRLKEELKGDGFFD